MGNECERVAKNQVLGRNISFLGSLSGIYFRVDTTRIEYSIPLRENWALPYFACQVAALTGYLKSSANTYGEVRARLASFLTVCVSVNVPSLFSSLFGDLIWMCGAPSGSATKGLFLTLCSWLNSGGLADPIRFSLMHRDPPSS